MGKEKRHACGIRHDGKEKEMFDVEKGDPAGRQAEREMSEGVAATKEVVRQAARQDQERRKHMASRRQPGR